MSEIDRAARALERFVEGAFYGAVDGTVTIVSITEPAGRRRFCDATVEVETDAAGLAPQRVSLEVVLDRRLWPASGTRLPARIGPGENPALDVNWDALAR